MMISRPARPDEIETLQNDLKRDKRNWEQVDLSKAIVFVSEKDGVVVEYISARLMWQVDTLKFVHGARAKLTPLEQKRSTYMLARRMIDWLSDTRNNPYIRSFFSYMTNKVMQKYALKFGLIPIYRKGNGKFFGKDL
jgi:hypothetical protein